MVREESEDSGGSWTDRPPFSSNSFIWKSHDFLQKANKRKKKRRNRYLFLKIDSQKTFRKQALFRWFYCSEKKWVVLRVKHVLRWVKWREFEQWREISHVCIIELKGKAWLIFDWSNRPSRVGWNWAGDMTGKDMSPLAYALQESTHSPQRNEDTRFVCGHCFRWRIWMKMEKKEKTWNMFGAEDGDWETGPWPLAMDHRDKTVLGVSGEQRSRRTGQGLDEPIGRERINN